MNFIMLYNVANMKCSVHTVLLTLGACARVTVVVLCVYLSVCLSVTVLAATYLVYTLKTRCH